MPRSLNAQGRIGLTEEKIIDYSRQRNVNRAFVIIAVAFCAAGFVMNYMNPSEFNKYVVFVAMPVALFLISTALGAGSKRAIDYIPGEWETRKVWVSFAEFEERTPPLKKVL